MFSRQINHISVRGYYAAGLQYNALGSTSSLYCPRSWGQKYFTITFLIEHVLMHRIISYSSSFPCTQREQSVLWLLHGQPYNQMKESFKRNSPALQHQRLNSTIRVLKPVLHPLPPFLISATGGTDISDPRLAGSCSAAARRRSSASWSAVPMSAKPYLEFLAYSLPIIK